MSYEPISPEGKKIMEIVEDLATRLHDAYVVLRNIADDSPNWFEPDAVADADRRKGRMAREALPEEWK